MTLHLKSRGYPFRPRVLFSSFIVVGVGFPNCVLFQERTLFIAYVISLAYFVQLAADTYDVGLLRRECELKLCVSLL